MLQGGSLETLCRCCSEQVLIFRTTALNTGSMYDEKVRAASKTGTKLDGKYRGLFLDFTFVFNQIEFLPFLHCLESLSFTPDLKMAFHVFFQQGCPKKHKTSQS